MSGLRRGVQVLSLRRVIGPEYDTRTKLAAPRPPLMTKLSSSHQTAPVS